MVFHWPFYDFLGQNKCEWMTDYLEADVFFKIEVLRWTTIFMMKQDLKSRRMATGAKPGPTEQFDCPCSRRTSGCPWALPRNCHKVRRIRCQNRKCSPCSGHAAYRVPSGTIERLAIT